jgi:cell wall-associated NlpC family hydrolase
MKLYSAVNIRQAVIAALFSVSSLLATSVSFAPTAAAAGVAPNKPAVVTNTGGGGVRFREGAGVGYDVKGTLGEGDTVQVLEGPVKDAAGHSWWRVTVNGSGRVGWVDTRYLGPAGSTSSGSKATTSSKTTTAKAPAGLKGYAKVATPGGAALRLRSTPGGAIQSTAAQGTVFSIVKGPSKDKNGDSWYQVSNANITGWASAAYLVSAPAPKKTTQAATAKKATTTTTTARTGTARGATQPPVARSSTGGVVSVAMKYVGYAYRYGGTSPAGFDCSGFVYYVFNKAGIGLSRAMSSQIASGPHISSSQLQPGDLVYFANTYRSGISHIAIYAGNGKIVHAADYGIGVTVSDLWSPYWVAHYAGATRVAR